MLKSSDEIPTEVVVEVLKHLPALVLVHTRLVEIFCCCATANISQVLVGLPQLEGSH